MFEDETFSADNLNTEPPTVPTTSINQGHTLSANTITSGVPSIDEASLAHVYNFSTGELISGAPIVPILLYDAALGRIANEAESRSIVDTTIKSSNNCIINNKPNNVELAA